MNAYLIITAFALAFTLAWGTNWLALGPWRRSRHQHWSEQARLSFPVVVAARTNLLSLPALMVLSVLLWQPDTERLWLWCGLAAFLGAYAGTASLDRELRPWLSWREWLRLAAIGFSLRSVQWVAFIGAATLMPNEFNAEAWTIIYLTLILWGVYVKLLSRLAKALGWLIPPPERLQNIVTATAAKMNVRCREVLVMRLPMAQAYAVPGKGRLIFTTRLLDLLSDEEIAAVAAHELGHLTESRGMRFMRSTQRFMFWPWIFFNPLMHQFGILAFFALLIITVAVPHYLRKLSVKLEVRADKIALANEGDAGTYARALAKLYEDNLTPAVTVTARATHPALYDRMLAAGVTPDFERPKPAATMAWHGRLFSSAAGGLFGIFAVRLVHSYIQS